MKYDFPEYDYLKPAHEENKKILKVFRDLCKSQGWKFYLTHGTLLGAARHQDCIPWDDDIDVAMPRDDYERLIQYYQTSGINGYLVSCFETDNVGNNIFIKFVNLNSPESLKKYQTHPKGMSIDIFPLDEAYALEDRKQRLINKKIRKHRLAINVKERLENKTFHDSFIGKIKKRAFLLLFPGKSIETLISETIALCKTNEGKNLKYCVNYCTPYSAEKEVNPKEYWREIIYLPLGDEEYPAPVDYKKVLTHVYGESWTQIPSDKLRYQHTEYQHSFWEDNNTTATEK